MSQQKKKAAKDKPEEREVKISARMIKINIWHDDKFPFLSDDAQLVWFHVYTNPLSNGLGLFHATVEGLAAAKKWPFERYRKGFVECLGNGLFVYDERYQSIYFPRFLEHNKPANPNVMAHLLKVWDYIPQTPYKHQVIRDLQAFGASYIDRIETLRLTLPQTLPPTIPETDTDTDTDTDKKTPFPEEKNSNDITNGSAAEIYKLAKAGGEF